MDIASMLSLLGPNTGGGSNLLPLIALLTLFGQSDQSVGSVGANIVGAYPGTGQRGTSGVLGSFGKAGLGGTAVDRYGNAPMTDMFGINLNGDQTVHHDNSWMQGPGGAIGSAVGSIWGMPGLGAAAGRNAGQTTGDLFAGNIDGLGADVSQNLPPGLQAKGWGGLANGATGLPIDKIISLFG